MGPFCYLLNVQKYTKNSWKQKIDPAADKPVKFYIDGLTRLEKTLNEGRLHFSNDFIEPLNKKNRGKDTLPLYAQALDVLKARNKVRSIKPNRVSHRFAESLRDAVETLDKISTILAHSNEKGIATDSQPLDLFGSGG